MKIVHFKVTITMLSLEIFELLEGEVLYFLSQSI
jgi:hypothetical protein